MAELLQIPLHEIAEPPIPMREAMDQGAMDELVASIRKDGLVQAITVRLLPDVTRSPIPSGNGGAPISSEATAHRYEIVAGHRRFIAHQLLQCSTIKAEVRDLSDEQAAATMLAENLCREDVTDAEIAIWLCDMRDKFNWSEDQLCKAVRRSPDWIADRIRLYRGDQEVFNALRERKITFSVARELNKCKRDDMRHYYLHQAMQSTPPARVVAQWVNDDNLQAMVQQPATAQAIGEVQADPNAPVVNECALCGGHKDPWNLIHVQIHKQCWGDIQKAVQSVAKET